MFPFIIEASIRSFIVGAIAALGLLIFSVRNVRLERAVWIAVLAAALLIPALMEVPDLRIPVSLVTSNAVRQAEQARTPEDGPPHTTVVREVRRLQERPHHTFSPLAFGTVVYLGVGGMFLARLLFGLYRAWRIRSAARSIHEIWTGGADVRVSSEIRTPVTIGRTILVPEDFAAWDSERQRAVIVHELSHVTQADSLLLAIASLHRAIFWISPLAWWLPRRLAELAEAISDEVALEDAPNRSSYAELLIDLAQRMDRFPSLLAMARPATISRRIERILKEAKGSGILGWPQRLLLAAGAIPVVILAAGSSFGQGQPVPPIPLPPIASVQEPTAPPQPPSTPVPPNSAQPPSAPLPPSAPTPPEKRVSTWWWSSSDGEPREPYVIVSGDSLTMSGSQEDAERARTFRNEAGSDYIWFVRDGKPCMVNEPNLVRRAKELFRPQEELGRRQAELGKQQAKLSEQQARLRELQAQVRVHAPSTEALERLERELQQMRAKLKSSNGEISEQALRELQARIAELQSAFGEAQSRAGEKQSALGEEQSKMGEQQSKLGEQQSKLGEQQSRLAEAASRQLRGLLDEAIRSGAAHRVQ